jgi:hypothetical protein
VPDVDGVEIYKRFYPWPNSFRIGDPVLVNQVTGMTWPDFTAALDDQNRAIAEAEEMGGEPPQADQVILAGLIAVAFWQGNPQMSRDKARRAIERVPMEDVEIIEGETDISPPEQAAGEPPKLTSSESDASPEAQEETEILPASTSDETSPNGSGEHGSPSVLPESLPA